MSYQACFCLGKVQQRLGWIKSEHRKWNFSKNVLQEKFKISNGPIFEHLLVVVYEMLVFVSFCEKLRASFSINTLTCC